MICSRLASAVSMSTGSLASLASARTAFSKSRPGMPGMFQSVIRKSNEPALQQRQRRVAVVGFGDVAVAELLQQALDDPAHGREIVDHQNFHCLLTSTLLHSRQIVTDDRASRPVAPADAPAPGHGSGRCATHSPCNTAPISFKIQLIVVIQGHHHALALRQARDGLGERGAKIFIDHVAERVRVRIGQRRSHPLRS